MNMNERDGGGCEGGLNVTLTIRLLMHGKEVGSIIGKSGARINISDGSSPERIVTITGAAEVIFKAFAMIAEKFEEDILASMINSTVTSRPPVTLRLVFPASQCGSLIGKGGSKIKEIRESTGAQVQVAGDLLPDSTERAVTISGTPHAITQCVKHICTVMLESPPKGATIPYRPKPSAVSSHTVLTQPHAAAAFAIPGQFAIPPQDTLHQHKPPTALLTHAHLRASRPCFSSHTGENTNLIASFQQDIRSLRHEDFTQSSYMLDIYRGGNGQAQGLTKLHQLAMQHIPFTSLGQSNPTFPGTEVDFVAINILPLHITPCLHTTPDLYKPQHVLLMPTLRAAHICYDFCSGGLEATIATTSQELSIPNDLIGCIIGRQGSKINEIRQMSGAQIKIAGATDGSAVRHVTITGAPANISVAHLEMARLSLQAMTSPSSSTPIDLSLGFPQTSPSASASAASPMAVLAASSSAINVHSPPSIPSAHYALPVSSLLGMKTVPLLAMHPATSASLAQYTTKIPAASSIKKSERQKFAPY
ncbi:hypothetical protein DNTS_024231 [Danionella cerebrum]|uniref:K Homology domain-containing protein n=1 Tax=Danionella cerebrum TaxID=2873325 RepID=A0A553QB77_9TELE|nr:hypothetical protein DNTS_024231 [Danionella translucida]